MVLAYSWHRIRRFFGAVDCFSCKLIGRFWRDSLRCGDAAEGGSMRPRERRDSGQNDLFKARLDQIADMNRPLMKLARTIDWDFLEKSFGAVYSDGPGQPPLPTRLMAGLAILKHTDDLSDEVLCERWLDNPYYRLFCGEEFFCHKLPFERSSLTRWRQRMGEEKANALLQESLSVAPRTGAIARFQPCVTLTGTLSLGKVQSFFQLFRTKNRPTLPGGAMVGHERQRIDPHDRTP
jgi:Transposase domain (DUF772)